jgi:hypothetical protein
MGHHAMAAHIRKQVGGRAYEKLKAGERGFLQLPTFEAHSLIWHLKTNNLRKELRDVATSPQTHPTTRELAWEAMRLMEEPRMG